MNTNTNFTEEAQQRSKLRLKCPFQWHYKGQRVEDQPKSTSPPPKSQRSPQKLPDTNMSESPRTDRVRKALLKLEEYEGERNYKAIVQHCIESVQMLQSNPTSDEERNFLVSVKLQTKMADGLVKLGNMNDAYHQIDNVILPTVNSCPQNQIREEWQCRVLLSKANCLAAMGDLDGSKSLVQSIDHWFNHCIQNVNLVENDPPLQYIMLKYDLFLHEQMNDAAENLLLSGLQTFTNASTYLIEEGYQKILQTKKLQLQQISTSQYQTSFANMNSPYYSQMPEYVGYVIDCKSHGFNGFNQLSRQANPQANQALKVQISQAYYQLFKVQRSQGEIYKAIDYLRHAIENDQNNWALYFEHSMFMRDAFNSKQDAYVSMQNAIFLKPDNSKVWYESACMAEEQCEYDQATMHFETAKKLDPDNAEIHKKHAQMYHNLKKSEEAITFLGQALQTICTKYNFDCFTKRQFSVVQAIYECNNFQFMAAYQQANQIDDQQKQLRQNVSLILGYMGFLYMETQQSSDAFNYLRESIDIDCTILANYLYLAQMEMKRGYYDNSHSLCDRVLTIDPYNEKAYEIKGNTFNCQQRLQEAVMCFQRAVEVNPENHVASSSLGLIFHSNGKLQEAIQQYKKCLQLKCDKGYTLMQLYNAKQRTCDYEEMDKVQAQITEVVSQQLQRREKPCMDPFTVFMMPYTGEQKSAITKAYSDEIINLTRKQVLSHGYETVPKFNFQIFSPQTNNFPKIRIGYVSYDFGDHPLGALMASVFKFHDRNKFVVVGFCLRPNDGSEWRRRIEQGCDEFYEIPRFIYDIDLADFVYKKNIQILFNLGGYTTGARNELFFLRPSPIQINYMGFCGSMMAEFMDYIITDETVSPLNCVKSFYSEKAIYMPNSYFVNDYYQSSQYCLIDPDPDFDLEKDSSSSSFGTQHSNTYQVISPNTGLSYQAQVAINPNVLDSVQKQSLLNQQTGSVPTLPVRSTPYLVGVVRATPQVIEQPKASLSPMLQQFYQDQQMFGNKPPLQFTRRSIRAEHGLPQDKFIFANFNSLYKLDHITYSVWMKIMKRVPNSVLWLLEYQSEAKTNLKKEAQARGVDPDRIIFTKVANKHVHIERCGLADLCLDNPVTNGHTTNCDLLWSGLPLITFPYSENMPSRVGASICYALGCPEMLLSSYDEYEEMAVRLALGSTTQTASKFNNRCSRPSSSLFDSNLPLKIGSYFLMNELLQDEKNLQSDIAKLIKDIRWACCR